MRKEHDIAIVSRRRTLMWRHYKELFLVWFFVLLVMIMFFLVLGWATDGTLSFVHLQVDSMIRPIKRFTWHSVVYLFGFIVFALKFVMPELLWHRRLNQAIANRAHVREMVEHDIPFALYLRNFSVEKSLKTIAGRSIPHHASATRVCMLIKPYLNVLALWDPSDARRIVPFLPVLSEDSLWRKEIPYLIAHSRLIIIDIEIPSSGVVEEMKLLLRTKCYEKILILFTSDETEWWMRNCNSLFASARWKLNVGRRVDRILLTHESATDRFILPEDLKGYLGTIITSLNKR